MELYKRIIEIIDANIIYCLIPILLTLLLIELFLKNRFETKKVLNLIRWTIIFYAVITWTYSLIGMALYPDKFSIINRATGRYKVAYLLMFFSALILPFTLLINKLASKFLYVLLIAFCLKMGYYFERFVIITTSYDRDYQTVNNEFVNSLLFGVGVLFIQGIIIAFLALGIFEIKKRKDIPQKRIKEDF